MKLSLETETQRKRIQAEAGVQTRWALTPNKHQRERSQRGPILKVKGQNAIDLDPPFLPLPYGMVMWCMRRQAGTAGALRSQKFWSHSHRVSFSKTDAREHSVRKGHSVWYHIKRKNLRKYCWSHLAANCISGILIYVSPSTAGFFIWKL